MKSKAILFLRRFSEKDCQGERSENLNAYYVKSKFICGTVQDVSEQDLKKRNTQTSKWVWRSERWETTSVVALILISKGLFMQVTEVHVGQWKNNMKGPKLTPQIW